MLQSSNGCSNVPFLFIRYDRMYHLSNRYSSSKVDKSIDIDLQGLQINIHKDTYEVLFYFLYSPTINSIIKKTSSESSSILLYKEKENDSFDHLLPSRNDFPVSAILSKKVSEINISINQLSIVLLSNENMQLCKLDVSNSVINISETLYNSLINISVNSLVVENHKHNKILLVSSQDSNAVLVSIKSNKNTETTAIKCKLESISSDIVPNYIVLLVKELYSPIIFSNSKSSSKKNTYSIPKPLVISIQLDSFSSKLMNSLNLSEYIKISLSYSACKLSLCGSVQSCSASIGEISLFSNSNNIESRILTIPNITVIQHDIYDYLDINVDSIAITIKIESVQTVHAIIHSYNFSKNDRSLTMTLSDSTLSSVVQPQKKTSSGSQNSYLRLRVHLNDVSSILIEKNMKYEINFHQISSEIAMSYGIIKLEATLQSSILKDNFNNDCIICQFGGNEECCCLNVSLILSKYGDSSANVNMNHPLINVSDKLNHFVDHISAIVNSLSFTSSSDSSASNESSFGYSPLIVTLNLYNSCISIYEEINIRILFNLTFSCLSIDDNDNKILTNCVICNKVDVILLEEDEDDNQLITSIPFNITCCIDMIKKSINVKLISLIPINVRINGSMILPLLNQSQDVEKKEGNDNLASFLSVISSYSYVLNLEACIKNISLFFISDVYSSSYPFLLFKIPLLQLTLSDSMRLFLNTSFSLSYFDRSLSHWQPVLEGCSVEMHIEITIDSNRITLGITVILSGNDENKTIEINFIPSFMHEVLCYLHKYKYILNDKKEIKRTSNVVIYNYSGLNLYHISIPFENENNILEDDSRCSIFKDKENKMHLISTLQSNELFIFNYDDSSSKISSLSSFKSSINDLQVELHLDEDQNIIIPFSSSYSFRQWLSSLHRIMNCNRIDDERKIDIYHSFNNRTLKTKFFQNKLKDRMKEIPNCSMYNIKLKEEDDNRLIQFQIGYETENLSVNIDKCLVTHYNIRYNKSTLPVIIDTSLNENNKLLVIKSPFEISVHDFLDLKIYLFNDKKEVIESHTIKSKYYIPIKYCELNCYIQFGLKNVKSNMIQISEIVYHGNGKGFMYISFDNEIYFFCNIQTSLSHSITDNSTTKLYKLNILSPLTVNNTTFYDISYEITNDSEKVVFNQKIKKHKSENVYIKQNFKDEEFFITVKNQYKNEIISKLVQLSVNKPITIPFDHDIQRKIKYISIDLMKLPNGTYSLYFYSDIWIINHSGVELFTYVKCNKAFINLPVSYCQLYVEEKKIIDKNDWESQITSVSFSNENEMVLSFADQNNGIESQPFYINSVNIPTSTQIPLYHNNSLHYDVEIKGDVLDDIYFHTKIIEILPSYWIWNGSINSINVRQTGDSNIKRVDTHESLPFQWNYLNENLTIQIQINEINEKGEEWNWSGNIKIDNDPITIRLYTCNYRRSKFLNISHIMVKGTIALCINDVDEQLTSHSIVNDCLYHNVLIYEENTNTNTIQSLLPLSKSPFGFIHPNDDKQIYILLKPYIVHSDDIDSYYNSQYLFEIPYKFTSSITQSSLDVEYSKDSIHFYINVEYVNNQFILHISSNKLPSLSLKYEDINNRMSILQKEIEYEQKMVNTLEQKKLPSNKVNFENRPDYLVITVLYALNLPLHMKGTACLLDNRRGESVSFTTSSSGKNVGFYQLRIIKVHSVISIFIGDGDTNRKNCIASGEIDVNQLKYDQITKMAIPLQYLYNRNNMKKNSGEINCCLLVNVGFTNNYENYNEDNTRFKKAILSKMLKHSRQIIQYYDKEIEYCSSIQENQVLSSSFILKSDVNNDNTLVISKTRVLAKSNTSQPIYLVIQTIDDIYHSDILSTSKHIETQRVKYTLIPNFTIKIINNKVIINKLLFQKDSQKYSMLIPGSEIKKVNDIEGTVDNFDTISTLITSKDKCVVEIETPNVYEYIWNFSLHLSERECLSEIFILTYQVGNEISSTNNKSLVIIDNNLSEHKLDSFYIDSFTEYYSLNGKLALNAEDSLLGRVIYTYNSHINSQSMLMVNDINKTSIDISIKSNPVVKSIISDITSHIFINGISITLYDNCPSEICNLSLNSMNIVFDKKSDGLSYKINVANIELSDTSGESIYPVVLSYHYQFQTLELRIKMKSSYIIDEIDLEIPVYIILYNLLLFTILYRHWILSFMIFY